MQSREWIWQAEVTDNRGCGAESPQRAPPAAAGRGAAWKTPGTPRGATWRSRPAATAPPARQPGRAQTRRPLACGLRPPAAVCCGALPPAAARTAAAARCAVAPGCSSHHLLPAHKKLVRSMVTNARYTTCIHTGELLHTALFIISFQGKNNLNFLGHELRGM